MTLGTLLIVVLLIMAIGSHPRWPYSRSWGYYPSGTMGLLVLVVVLLVLTGRM